MNDNASRLREAFETHERLAPDPADVYAEVQRLARAYQRRRWGAHAAGGAVLGAGLIAGMIYLPALLSEPPRDSVAVAPAAAPSASAPERDQERELDAYFDAGYDYGDALRLARLWNRAGDDITQIKADAGRRLLDGEILPVQPTPGDEPSSPEPPSSSPEDLQVETFFKAGYDYEDAVKLAELWKTSDPYQAKVEGGKRLLAGETLPIKP